MIPGATDTSLLEWVFALFEQHPLWMGFLDGLIVGSVVTAYFVTGHYGKQLRSQYDKDTQDN